ncbi:MAG: hypothetical protein RIC95_09650 [Vicingaceae bacterium]
MKVVYPHFDEETYDQIKSKPQKAVEEVWIMLNQFLKRFWFPKEF